MFTINTTALANSLNGSYVRFIRLVESAISQPAADNLNATLRTAHEQFAANGGNRYAAFIDLQFVETHCAPVIVDYLNGTNSRHESAIEIARIWEGQLVPVNSKLRKQRMANASMAIDEFLAYLPTDSVG
jgi:hypothetical protein